MGLNCSAVMSKIPVGILGATGAVGQRFIQLLADHPWFEIAELAASDRSAGKAYRDACTWRLASPVPEAVARLGVTTCEGPFRSKLLFSGLDSSVAGEVETALAGKGHAVVSNSRNHRMDTDVPLLIPEVNPNHLDALAVQRKRTGGGYIVTNPNCSVMGLAIALAPLHRSFGVEAVAVVTLQALSGAGYPGVASMDIADNVVPFIGGGEEEKIETETNKILGALQGGAVAPHPVAISATTTRVPVHNGHTGSISIATDQKPDHAAIVDAWNGFRGKPQQMQLPSAPAQPIVFLTEANRPQPALDANRDGGMTVSVGRLRACPVLDYKFVALGHNTIRGAAGAAVLNAELMHCEGLL